MNFYLKENLNNISCLLKIMFVYTTIQSKIVRRNTKKKTYKIQLSFDFFFFVTDFFDM